MKKIYITTSIAYANAKPHVGHALEAVQADVLARYYRKILGKENIYFLTGTDEHGQKNFETAKKNNVEPQKLVDQNADFFKTLYTKLDITNDDFIRTTEERHKKAAQKIWNACQKDIYKKKYQGLYCVGCETFITEKELENGLCPNHKKKPEIIEEENYFFKLSKYSKDIEQLISADRIRIIPETRKKEMLSLLRKKGLEDISISREATRLPWGIEVPNDPSQKMYVWFDALTNYISAIGYENNKENFHAWWESPETQVLQCIGKDILRHHAGIWPSMLLSAGIKLPGSLFVHGFITSNGQKMSKSLGNVIDPDKMVSAYGSEVVRYYLLHQIPSGEDGDFSLEKMKQLYTSNLSNALGNLLSRTANMIEKFLDGKISVQKQETNTCLADEEFQKYMRDIQLHLAFNCVWNKIYGLNKFIDDSKPWQLAKNNPERVKEVLEKLYVGLLNIADVLEIFLPKTAKAIHSCLMSETITKPKPIFPPLSDTKINE